MRREKNHLVLNNHAFFFCSWSHLLFAVAHSFFPIWPHSNTIGKHTLLRGSHHRHTQAHRYAYWEGRPGGVRGRHIFAADIMAGQLGMYWFFPSVIYVCVLLGTVVYKGSREPQIRQDYATRPDRNLFVSLPSQVIKHPTALKGPVWLSVFFFYSFLQSSHVHAAARNGFSAVFFFYCSWFFDLLTSLVDSELRSDLWLEDLYSCVFILSTTWNYLKVCFF